MDAVIQTKRLDLRHFKAYDLDALSELMADADFMLFSSGVFTREQTASFLFDRVLTPAQAGWPSQYAVIARAEIVSSATADFSDSWSIK